MDEMLIMDKSPEVQRCRRKAICVRRNGPRALSQVIVQTEQLT